MDLSHAGGLIFHTSDYLLSSLHTGRKKLQLKDGFMFASTLEQPPGFEMMAECSRCHDEAAAAAPLSCYLLFLRQTP